MLRLADVSNNLSANYLRLALTFLLCISSISSVAAVVQLPPLEIRAPAEQYLTTQESTAHRTSSAVLETPFSLGVLGPIIMQDSQALRLEDIAPLISGVQASSSDSGLNTDLNIRGFSTRGTTYLNGLLDNQRFQVRDMALVERIEILKGHASVLYGAGNPGGTVNYLSKQPQAEQQLTASVTAATGSGDSYLGRLILDATGPLNSSQSILFRFIAAGQLGHEFRSAIVNDRATFAPSLLWHYSDSGTIKLDFEYSYQNQPYRFDNVYTLGQVVYDQSYVDPRAQSDRDNWRFTTQILQKIWSDWEVNLSSQYIHVERDELLLGFNTFLRADTLSAYYRRIHDHYDQLSTRGEMHGKFTLLGLQPQLIAGVEHNFTDARLHSQLNNNLYPLNVYQPSFNHTLPTPATTEKNTLTHEMGCYLTEQTALTRYLQIYSGIRYSTFSAELNTKTISQQQAVSLSAGINVNPLDTASLYFGYSQSFSPNTGITRSQQFLPAKRGELVELGFKSQLLEQQLGLNAAIYQLSQNHVSGIDPLDKDAVVANGKLRSNGVELDITGHISKQLDLIANYSWIAARFVQHESWQGHVFHSTPAHSGAFWGKYELPLNALPGRLHLGLGIFWSGSRFGDDQNSFRVAGYIRPDLFAHYHWRNLDINLKVENLLDKRYVSSANFDDTVIQGNRLLLRGTLQLGF